MSIKYVALDLYRAQQKVEELTHALKQAGPAEEQKLRAELREAEEDLRKLRRILDGAKKPLPFRTSLKKNP